jgi:hypothetical protein
VKATVPNPTEPFPRSVTEVPDQEKVTQTKKGGAASNPAPKHTKALRQYPVKNTQENVKTGKSSSKIPNPKHLRPHLKPPSHPSRSAIYSILFLLALVWNRRVGSSQLHAPSLIGVSVVVRPENRSLRSRIWQPGLKGRTWRKLCAWNAGMLMVIVANSGIGTFAQSARSRYMSLD